MNQDTGAVALQSHVKPGVNLVNFVISLVHVVSTRSFQQNMRRHPEFKIRAANTLKSILAAALVNHQIRATNGFTFSS